MCMCCKPEWSLFVPELGHVEKLQPTTAQIPEELREQESHSIILHLPVVY